MPHYYLNQEQLEISEEEFYGLADFRFNLFKEMQYDFAIVSFLYDRQKFGQLSQVQLQIKGESRISLEKIGASEKSLKANIVFSQDICIGYFNDTHPLGTRAFRNTLYK